MNLRDKTEKIVFKAFDKPRDRYIFFLYSDFETFSSCSSIEELHKEIEEIYGPDWKELDLVEIHEIRITEERIG